MQNRLLFCFLLLIAQGVFATSASAQAHMGDYYCGDCSFGGAGRPISPEGSTFIRITVNPDLGSTGWLYKGNPRTVVICNGTTCALYTYTGGGAFVQVGPEYPDDNDQDEYENPEDAPADPPASSGGGGGSGGRPPGRGPGAPGCIYGCGGTGTVEIGELEQG